jgi:Protein of unknown function (DUF2905)
MLTNAARIFLIIGAVFLVIGGLLYFAGRLNLPLGKLPGDFTFQGKGYTCFIPVATFLILSILLSIILTIVTNFLGRK